MTSTSIVTNKEKNIMLYRHFTPNASLSDVQYLAPTVFKVGVSSSTSTVSDTDLDKAVPISNGTVIDAADSSWTGSNAGQNSTNNTTTFKEGAGASDVTSQNMLGTNTNVLKTWTKGGLSMSSAQPISFWLYIKDITTLAKFKSSGTCVQLRIRTSGDAATSYYEKSWTITDLATLWNYLDAPDISTLSIGAGAPSGALNEVIIEITTNNATDTFSTGDVIYDLLRQWADSDLIKTYVSGYPSLDYVKNECTLRCYLNILEANGFLIDGFATFNEDATPLLASKANFTGQSKSSTDEFSIIYKTRII